MTPAVATLGLPSKSPFRRRSTAKDGPGLGGRRMTVGMTPRLPPSFLPLPSIDLRLRSRRRLLLRLHPRPRPHVLGVRTGTRVRGGRGGFNHPHDNRRPPPPHPNRFGRQRPPRRPSSVIIVGVPGILPVIARDPIILRALVGIVWSRATLGWLAPILSG